MNHQLETFLEIDLSSLKHNYQFLRSKLKPETKLLAVIKAFAYGHDAVAIANTLTRQGVDYFAVAYINEGITLRNNGIKTPILILHPQYNDLDTCITYNLEPNIYNFRILEHYLKQLKQKEKQLNIHIKFNTGLNRLGFNENDITKLTQLLKTPYTKLTSVLSHLIASEDLNLKELTQNQIKQYKSIVRHLEQALEQPFIKHITNTSGTLNYPEAHFDMVRSGIGLYGYGNDPNWTKHLKPVGKLYSTITQINTIQPNQSIGYNQGHIAKTLTRGATIPLGHADGIPRSWGKGKGYVTINNQKAFILGNVCMDTLMVDITNINCEPGDRVIVFDNQQTVEDLSKRTNTISYEIITTISQRVPRVVLSE